MQAMIVRPSHATKETAGIFLNPVPGVKGTYKRVGSFYVREVFGDRGTPKRLEDISKEHNARLQSEEYVSKRLDESGHTHYTIDII